MASSALKAAGWKLTEEGEKLCGGSVKAALDLDLRDIGAECLSEEINRGKANALEGGFVLQVGLLLLSHFFLDLCNCFFRLPRFVTLLLPRLMKSPKVIPEC